MRRMQAMSEFLAPVVNQVATCRSKLLKKSFLRDCVCGYSDVIPLSEVRFVRVLTENRKILRITMMYIQVSTGNVPRDTLY